MNVTRTWEFNPVAPVRSIVPIYLVIGIPLYMLRGLSSIFGSSLITWYSVAITVRGSLSLLSFIVDICTYRLAQSHQRGSGVASLMFISSSYVTLVFYTRPFSNTLESLLFAGLLYVVISDQSVLAKQLAKKDASVVQKSSVYSSRTSSALMISALIVAGIFNRPTFVVFAVVPGVYWLMCCIPDNASKKQSLKLIVTLCLQCLTFAVGFLIVFTVCDSVYFGRLTSDIAVISQDLSYHGFISLVLKNLTVTPINFILYNTQTQNLAEHGVHPRITHFLVNFPLLFSVSACYFFAECFLLVARVLRSRQTLQSGRVFIIAAVFVPVALLSLFPHQEPRFLIPLLVPMAALYASKIFSRSSRCFCVLWFLTNLLGCLFFGILHQGGVVRALGHIQQTRLEKSESVSVIFTHTYMPPKHLLLLTNTISNSSVSKHKPDSSVQLYDFAGKPVSDVIDFVKSSLLTSVDNEQKNIFVVIPGSLENELICQSENVLNLTSQTQFWPHISTESLPFLSSTFCHSDLYCDSFAKICNLYTTFQRILSVTSLKMYRVLTK